MIAKLIPAELHLPEPKTARTQGVHVSTLIKSMAQKNGSLKTKMLEELSLVEVGTQEDWWKALPPAARLRIAIGLAWEEWYIPSLAQQGVIDHPGEMEVQKVYMTPDGESIDAIVLDPAGSHFYRKRIHEVKATYKSTKTVGDLSTQWLWNAQMKAYCKGAGCRHTMFHVNFICGDYSFPITPKLLVWDIEYTQLEIDDHWDALMIEKQHLENLDEARKNGEVV